jgi:uncharacterized protein YkwD
MRALFVALMGFVLLTACAQEPRLGSDGKPLPQLYRISSAQKAQIPYRVLEALNALRAAAGADAVQLDPYLTAAAATHALDMSVQNRPWHFGSDGSSPLDRVRRAGFDGAFLGETLSETFETELQTLTAWVDDDATRGILLDKRADRLGFAWHQEKSGKLWWVLVTGISAANGS